MSADIRLNDGPATLFGPGSSTVPSPARTLREQSAPLLSSRLSNDAFLYRTFNRSEWSRGQRRVSWTNTIEDPTDPLGAIFSRDTRPSSMI